jgi:uncharacterized protein (TIGR02596 family)
MHLERNDGDSHLRSRGASAGAFTLIELLLVLTIMVILMTLIAPTLNNVLRGSALTRGSDQVIGVLNAARQNAMTRNVPVEVRFYSFDDPEMPGVDSYCQGLQAFAMTPTNNSVIFAPITKVVQLPPGIVITTNPSLTSIVANSTNRGTNRIPRVGTNYTFSSFQYYRNGMTDLLYRPAGMITNWNITIINRVNDTGGGLPTNFTTITIDPYNGQSRIFRPTL